MSDCVCNSSTSNAFSLGTRGPGSSVGIATELRAGRCGMESRWGRDFPPVQTGPGAHPVSSTIGTRYFPQGEAAGGWDCPPHPYLECRSHRKSRAIPLLTLRAFVANKKGENILKRITQYGCSVYCNNFRLRIVVVRLNKYG